jgi:spermidine synthase
VILPFPFALVLAAMFGFTALAYEIVWARLFNFTSGSRAQAFGLMLASYLIGLALGALWSARLQRGLEGRTAGLRLLSRLSGISALVCFLVFPLASWISIVGNWVRFSWLIIAAATLLGTILPLLCHFAISPDGKAGARLSYVYLANIIGSGAGSLLTGFVLMDWFSISGMQTILVSLGLLLCVATRLYAGRISPVDGALWVALAALAVLSPRLHDGVYERLFFKASYNSKERFAQTVESRHGVINVTRDRTVLGNGAFDGIIETRLYPGSTLIRPYFLSAVHEHPRQVLVIGMSSGAWTQILASNSEVEHVTVIEISAAYLKIAESWPELSSILTNPKVEILIDDGRRWLRRNPEKKFDAIVMNTSLHWREFSAALLSVEFLKLTREHLNPGGVVMWNATDSARAIRTGLEVFPHTILVMNNCLGSLSPVTIDRDRWRRILESYRIDGKPVFDLTRESDRNQLAGVLKFADLPPFHPQWRLFFRPELERDFGGARVITDDNLGHEYDLDAADIGQALLPRANRK